MKLSNVFAYAEEYLYRRIAETSGETRKEYELELEALKAEARKHSKKKGWSK